MIRTDMRMPYNEPVSNVVFDQRVDVLTVEATSLGTGVERTTAKVIYA